MNFFNIGAGEFFLILILLMIVFGPERLPQLARQLGKAINDLKRFARDIDPELLQDFREITKDFESVRDEVTSLRSDLAEIQRDISGAAKDVSGSLNEVVQEAKVSTSLTTDPQAVRAAQAAAASAQYRAAAPVATSGPKPVAAAGVAGAAVGAAAAKAATGGATGAAAGAAPAGAAVGTSVPPIASASAKATAATSVGELQDEIVGVPLLLYGPGDGAFLDEIVGVKVFPVPRSGAHAAAPEPDGHVDQVAIRSRHAVMASLARRQSASRPLPAPRALTVRPRALPAARERMTRRG